MNPPQNHNASSTHHQSAAVEDNNESTVRMYTKANTNYSLTIRYGALALAPTNSSDHHQHWIKRFSTTIVKDRERLRPFSLVNKATGEAMSHVGVEHLFINYNDHRIQLEVYNPDKFDKYILWTQSPDLGDGFHVIRMVDEIKLNLHALDGDTLHGGVHDGTKVVLSEWKNGDNQKWTMDTLCKFLNSNG